MERCGLDDGVLWQDPGGQARPVGHLEATNNDQGRRAENKGKERE